MGVLGITEFDLEALRNELTVKRLEAESLKDKKKQIQAILVWNAAKERYDFLEAAIKGVTQEYLDRQRNRLEKTLETLENLVA